MKVLMTFEVEVRPMNEEELQEENAMHDTPVDDMRITEQEMDIRGLGESIASHITSQSEEILAGSNMFVVIDSAELNGVHTLEESE